MKLNFYKRLSSKLYTIVPMIILMGAMVNDCSFKHDILGVPKNPFAQTNTGRNVIAYRINGNAYMDYNSKFINHNHPQVWAGVHYHESGLNEFGLSHSGYRSLSVFSYDAFKVGKKYFVSDILETDDERIPAFLWQDYGYEAVSGWLEFRYFQDGIAAANFEVVLVGVEEPHDTLKITDGTFDVKCGSIGAKN